MFISFVVVECLYLIHWRKCKKCGYGVEQKRKKRLAALVSLCVSVHQSCEKDRTDTKDRLAQTWQLHGEW